jgi:hypothetical protein
MEYGELRFHFVFVGLPTANFFALGLVDNKNDRFSTEQSERVLILTNKQVPH